MSSARPQSASFRGRPQSGRARPSPAAIPQSLLPTPAIPVEAPVDEAYWLFSSAYRLTTTDIALAGFTAVVLLDAARWRGGAELSPEARCPTACSANHIHQSRLRVGYQAMLAISELTGRIHIGFYFTVNIAGVLACAAAELAYTFGFEDSLVPTVTSEHADALKSVLERCFAGRGGDLLIIFQNVTPEASQVEVDRATTVVARIVDSISCAYSAADEKETPNLAGISVVLEGFARSGQQTLEGNWDGGGKICINVLPFSDALPPA